MKSRQNFSQPRFSLVDWSPACKPGVKKQKGQYPLTVQTHRLQAQFPLWSSLCCETMNTSTLHKLFSVFDYAFFPDNPIFYGSLRSGIIFSTEKPKQNHNSRGTASLQHIKVCLHASGSTFEIKFDLYILNIASSDDITQRLLELKTKSLRENWRWWRVREKWV